MPPSFSLSLARSLSLSPSRSLSLYEGRVLRYGKTVLAWVVRVHVATMRRPRQAIRRRQCAPFSRLLYVFPPLLRILCRNKFFLRRIKILEGRSEYAPRRGAILMSLTVNKTAYSDLLDSQTLVVKRWKTVARRKGRISEKRKKYLERRARNGAISVYKIPRHSQTSPSTPVLQIVTCEAPVSSLPFVIIDAIYVRFADTFDSDFRYVQILLQ